MRRKHKILTSINAVLFLAGIALRLVPYLQNRSLWLDEAIKAVSIISLTPWEIIRHVTILPDWTNYPPLGFLLAEKLIVSLWNYSEYALRFFPLVCGIASLFFFYFLARRVLGPLPQTLALGLFVLCEPLVYFSSETKPYSSDVLAGLILFILFFRLLDHKFQIRYFIGFGAAGGLLMWVSHASLFVLTGAALITYWCCLRNDRTKMPVFFGVLIFWLLNFTGLYFISFQPVLSNRAITQFWESGFAPEPFWSMTGLSWMWKSVYSMFRDPSGMGFPKLAMVLALTGIGSFWPDRRKEGLAFALPVLLTLSAAVFHFYPFQGRVLLFLVPVLIIFTAEGICFFARLKIRGAGLFSVLAVLMIVFHSIRGDMAYFSRSCGTEDARSVVAYLKKHYHDGDYLAMNNFAQFSYWYYTSRPEFGPIVSYQEKITVDDVKIDARRVGQIYDHLGYWNEKPYAGFREVVYGYNERGLFRYYLVGDVSGREICFDGETPLDFIPAERVWVLLSHDREELKKFVLDSFDRRGKRVETFERQGAGIYLYRLKRGNQGS